MDHTPHTGFIIVRLDEGFDPRADVEAHDLASIAKKHGLADLIALLDRRRECATKRLVSAVPIQRCLELDETIRGRRGKAPRRSLASYWRVDARRLSDAEQDSLTAALEQIRGVALAYREVRGRNPEAPPPLDPFVDHQFHLLPAPVGVDAHFAHAMAGGRGELAGFVDLEQGWIFDHEDLPAIKHLTDVSYETVDTSLHHGTAVMGVAVGKRNGKGIMGIAPDAGRVNVTSHRRDGTPDHVVDAIEAILSNVERGALEPGDVLLIEWQDFFARPAEADAAIRDAIQKACGLGLVVVEAAGNANTDLDTVPDLTPGSATFEDSGAIVVGACHSALAADRTSHDRWLHPIFQSGSNFGRRVDCHAFGEHVVTAGPSRFPGETLGNGSSGDTQYRRDFGGTSAAAAIVAGVAVVVQSLQRQAGRPALSSEEMRELFRTLGTPQGGAVPGHIGSMPDLSRIADALG